MTISVTMRQTRRGEDGQLWLVGQTYPASDGFAAMLISSNLATGTLPKPPSTVQVKVDASGNTFAVGPTGEPIGVGAPILITGVPAVGNTLAAAIAAGWQNAGGNWTRNGANIAGATALTYPVVSADDDKDLTYKSSNIPFIPPAVRIGAAAPVVVAPGAPIIGVATGGDGVVNVVFTAPGSTGGSPILEYQAELSNTNTAYGAGSPIAVASANGAAVTGRVRARNAVDWGPWSANSNSVTPSAGATVPGAPGAPVATAGDGVVSATWTAAAANGATVTNHRLRWNGGTPVETGSASLSGSIPAANGVAGTLEVAAFNAIGWGPYSPASNSVTPSSAAVTQALIATFGDSLTNRTWDTVPGGATLNASGGVATLTIPSRSDPMLPGDLIRLTGTTNRNSPFYGEWPIASKPNNTTITFNYPTGLGNASSLAFNISYGNAICVEGYVTNLINKSRQKISIVPSMASDGERTDEIYTRMQDKLPGLASSLQAVTIFAGTNDISQGIAEATIIANIQAMISYAAARVPFVVVYTIPADDTARTSRANVNEATRAYVSANYSSSQVVVVDAATITESGAAGSAAKTGYLIDAVHLSGTPAHLIGTAGWNALSTKYPALAAVAPSGVNRLANGDNSAVTGNTANGVTFVNAASHTNTPSIVANPNGGNFQQLQIVATATAGASRIERVLDLPSLTAGKRYRLWADCELVGTPVNAPDFNLAVVLDATGVTAYQGRAYATGTGLGMGGTKQNWSTPISLRGRGNWITWPAGVTDARIRLTLATVGAGTNTIRLGGVNFEEEA